MKNQAGTYWFRIMLMQHKQVCISCFCYFAFQFHDINDEDAKQTLRDGHGKRSVHSYRHRVRVCGENHSDSSDSNIDDGSMQDKLRYCFSQLFVPIGRENSCRLYYYHCFSLIWYAINSQGESSLTYRKLFIVPLSHCSARVGLFCTQRCHLIAKGSLEY